MKKLSKIDESVWVDMHKRSNGEQVKKEDDVNLFDPEQLYEYTNSNYKDKVEYVTFLEGQNTKHVNVEIVVGLEVSINFSNDKIYNILIDLLDNVGLETVVIADNFNIEKINTTTFRIKEKDGTISNNTFLNLVNFILHNIDIVDIKESVWSDIHKRSNGEQVRKEDDINHMNRDEFFDYLDEHYMYTSKENPELYGLRKSIRHQSISVPIYQYGYVPYSIYLEYDADGGKFLSVFPFKGRYIMIPYIKIKEREPSVLSRLRQNFNVEEVFDMRGFDRIIKYLNIIPDDGEQPTNEFFLKVIDFMNDNIEEPLKKIFIKK